MNRLIKNKRLLATIILIIMFMTPMLEVLAHDAVFLQTVIDRNNYKYVSDIITDKVGYKNETRHLEARLANFKNVDGIDYTSPVDNPLAPFSATYGQYKEVEFLEGTQAQDAGVQAMNSKAPMIFSFPAYEEKGDGWFGAKNHATGEDSARAALIANTLTGSLNSVLSYVNGGQRFTSPEHLITTSLAIRPESGGTTTSLIGPNNITYTITYETTPNDQGELIGRITKGVNNEEPYEFVYGLPKGYAVIPGINNDKAFIRPSQPEYEYVSSGDDTAWITIHHLSMQANIANTKGIDFSAGAPPESQGAIEKMVLSMISSIFHGLLNLLGLYSVEEIIYNQGAKNIGIYNDGLMSDEWWGVVLRYHMIFQAIAWALIIGALIKILIQINFSTVNPTIRMSIYETFQKLFIVGLLLSTSIPVIRLMASLNNSIVSMFATQVDLSFVGRTASVGTIASILVELVFFAVTFYMNFVYIIRSIMLAILIASGPIFIVSMAFFLKGKGLFDGWLKELIANIFIQAFHAFAFAFIFNIQSSGGRGIEAMVTMMALIPLTDFFRTLIFGTAGSSTVAIGSNIGAQAENATKSVIGAGAGLVGGKVAGKLADSSIGEGSSSTTSNIGENLNKGGQNAFEALSDNMKNASKGNVEKSKAEGYESQEVGTGVIQDAEGGFSFNKGGGNFTASVQTAQAGAFKAMSGGMTALKGVGDIASGNVFGNQKQAMQGASSVGEGAVQIGTAIGETAGELAGQFAGSEVGQGIASKVSEAGQAIKDSPVGEIGSNLKEGAIGAIDSYTGGMASNVRDIGAFAKNENMGYHLGTTKNPDGSTNYDLNSKKLGQATGITGIGLRKENGRNFVNMAMDTNKMNLTNEDGSPTATGQDFANMMQLSISENGRALLRNDFGIEKIQDMGNGQYNITGNETFIKNQGIQDIKQSRDGTKTRITKTAGSSAGMGFMPRVDQSLVASYTGDFEASQWIGVRGPDGHTSQPVGQTTDPSDFVGNANNNNLNRAIEKSISERDLSNNQYEDTGGSDRGFSHSDTKREFSTGKSAELIKTNTTNKDISNNLGNTINKDVSKGSSDTTGRDVPKGSSGTTSKDTPKD